MIQDVLAEPDWEDVLALEDYRGLTPLTWAHVAMHGEFKLNMSSRMTLGGSDTQRWAWWWRSGSVALHVTDPRR